MMKFNIPSEISAVCEKLKKAGHKAYLVGGCVRDILLSREPKDWDITTDAKPEEIQKIFKDSVYENNFGTVGVKTDSENEKLKVVEVTTFRKEGKYTDKRHPDEINFADNVEDDLSRRDFTVNAMSLRIDANDTNEYKLVDPFDGQTDLKNKIIRTVGNPEERFSEDALRLMRAVRLAAELGFEIEEKTFDAIKKHAGFLGAVANERIRDEFAKLIMADDAAKGMEVLEELGLLKHIIPELSQSVGVGQNKHHIYSVFEHSVKSLEYAAKKKYSLEIRMAALLHDIGKPKTKRGEGSDSTFYGHEVVGAKMTARILDNLRFSKNFIEKVCHLVRYHLFYYNVGEVTEAGVRRFLSRVGPENVDDFIKLREADRIGSGVPKAVPYKLRHLLFMIDKVRKDPISPKMLKINGNDLMKILSIAPGPKIGSILAILLDEVLEDPSKNDAKLLESRAKELGVLPEKELGKMAKSALAKKEEFESGEEEKMKKRHFVK
jgi:poly(A) polymerase/tRNA nucleotidyltransferase (CCA-adding enzyme)